MSMQFIPLNKLIASPRNVRRKDRKADIEALAASIAARGLLQNLCVVVAEDGKFEVDAGSRRHQALKLLAKTGAIEKDHPVACNVIPHEQGREVSLVENVHRLAMDAMDEVDAYAALISEGSTADEIAHRFGVTRRHVDQRLALAGLSPKIKAAWKRGDISLDAARAFCLVEDHAQQDAVFRSLPRPVTHAASVRARLMDDRLRATDRLAVFVGLEAYEQAGGRILRDLFDPEAVFIDNPSLLTKLAEDKLAASCAEWLAQGWSWAQVQLGSGRGEGVSATRFYPDWRDPTVDEQAELDRISAEIETLDAELEANAVDDDPRWSIRDDLEAAYETVRQTGRCWSAEARQVSGVVLSVDHDGAVCATEGLVRTVDQKRAEALLKKARAAEADEGEDDHEHGLPAARASALPKSVNRDLTLARTRAIRLTLSESPAIALAVCVASMASRSLRHADIPGVPVALQDRSIEDFSALEDAKADLDHRLPADSADLLAWALDLSSEKLLGVLANLVARSIDLTHEDTSPSDFDKQAVADLLAQHLDIDMRRFWSADLSFWVRLPKAKLIETLPDAPCMAERGARTREEAIKAHAKLRKDDLAAKVSVAFEGTGYLPDILVTPLAVGALELTAEGLAEVVPAVAAE